MDKNGAHKNNAWSQDASDNDKWFITSGAVRNLTMVVDNATTSIDDSEGPTATTRRPDIYLILVICTVVLLVTGAVLYGIVSAVLRLFKVEPPDVDTSAAVEAGNARSPQEDGTGGGGGGSTSPPTTSAAAAQPSTSSGGTLTRLANGKFSPHLHPTVDIFSFQ